MSTASRRCGQGRAREDASSRSFRDPARDLAGRDARLDRQPRAGREHAAAEREGVAVHGGLVEGWHCEGCDHLFRERAPARLTDRHVLVAEIAWA